MLYVAGDNNTSAMRNNAVLGAIAAGGVALGQPVRVACLDAYGRLGNPHNDTVAERNKAEME